MSMWPLLLAHFQNVPYQATGISWEIPEVCTKPAPHLAFTIPGSILNASLWSPSIWEVWFWGTGISGILLCCSGTLPTITHSFSSRVERRLISLDWDFISSACCKCESDRTETWVQWAISSLIISANKASLPWRACASADSWCKEALHWANYCCNSWALSTWCPMPSLMLCNEKALAREGLSFICSGFMLAYGRYVKNLPVTICLNWGSFVMNKWTVSWMLTQLSAQNMTQKWIINVMKRISHKLAEYKIKLTWLLFLTDCFKIHLQSHPLIWVHNIPN